MAFALKNLAFAVGGSLLGAYWDLRNRSSRRRRKRVLLIGTNYMMARELAFVARVLAGRPDVDVYCTTRPFRTVVDFDPRRFAAAVGVPYIPPLRAFLGRWDTFFTSSHMRAFSPGRTINKVFLSHGIASWKLVDGEIDILRDHFLSFRGRSVYTTFLCRGRDELELAHRVAPMHRDAFALSGDVVVDDLVAIDAERDRWRREMGLPATKPVVVVVSSHGPNSLVGRGARQLPSVLAALVREFSVILVNHPFNFYTRFDPELRDASRELLRLRLADLVVKDPEASMLPYLAVGDVAVSDFSSTCFYFMQLRRPIVLFAGGESETPPGAPFERLQAHCPVIRDLGGIAPAVRASLGAPVPQPVNALADELVAYKGEASARWRSLVEAAVLERKRVGGRRA
jgi:hypothetical protein